MIEIVAEDISFDVKKNHAIVHRYLTFDHQGLMKKILADPDKKFSTGL